MTGTTCATGCGEPTQDVMLLCRGCTGRLETVLGSVGAIIGHANVTLGRRAVMGARNDGGRSDDRPIPLHAGMYEAKLLLEAQLVGWTRDLAERHGEKALPAPDMASIASWLLARIWRIASHPAAGDIYDEITSSVAHVERLIDRPAEREFVGVCDVEHCPGWLYAIAGSASVSCEECGTMHPVAESRERLMDKLADRLMTQREIAGMATHHGINRRRAMKLMGSWVERGRLTPSSSTPDGEPLYAFGSTLKMLRDTPMRLRRAG